MVFYRSQQPPGTIIIDTQERHLYLIEDPTHAIRYGIGVGRAGFHLARLVANKPKGRMAGLASTPEMIERQPYLPRFTAGGPGNPPRYVSRQYRLPHPRYQCVGDDRPSRFIRLLPASQ